MRDLLLVTIVVICSLIAIRRPVFGILTYIFFGIVNPQGMVWDFGREFPLAMLTAMGTLVGYALWNEPKTFPRQREVVLLLALWLLFMVSTIFAIYPDRANPRLSHISKVLLMTFFCMSIINTEARLQMLVKVIGLSLGLYGLKSGVSVILDGGQNIVYGPEQSFLYSNNSIGLALAMNVPILVYLFKRENNRKLRAVIGAMILFSYPAIVCTYSRGAWLGLTAATAIIFFKSQRKVALATGLCIAIMMVLPLLPQSLYNRYDQLLNYKEEGSALSRFWNWEFCQRVGLSRPLYGGGFDFYSLENYARFYPEFLERWPDKVWSCHSTWFTILGEHGVLAFCLWLALIGSCFLSIRKLRAYGLNHLADSAWLIDLSTMLQGTFVAYIVVASFLDAAYFDMIYELIGAVVITKDIVRRAPVPVPVTPSVSDLRKSLSFSAS